MKLRELLKVARNIHYRVYQPNRDCLIFESFRKIHSPYFFDKEHEQVFETNSQYYDNNDFCDSAAHLLNKDPAYDKETELFLEKCGDMEVFAVEMAAFYPTKIFRENGELITEAEPRKIGCLDIFITYFDGKKTWGCERCSFSLLDKDGKSIPDPKDTGCKHCWRFIEDTVKEKAANEE